MVATEEKSPHERLFDELLRATDSDLIPLLEGREAAALERLERASQARLAALPIPLFEDGRDPLTKERRACERLLAHVAAKQGDLDPLIDLYRMDWLRGGSVMPFLSCLRDAGYHDQADLTARLAALGADDDEAEEIEAFMSGAGHPPTGWVEAVTAFARAPTEAGWDALLKFTPVERYDERVRAALRILRRQGVDADVIFQFATRDGVTPDAIELAEGGTVSIPVILERAGTHPPESRALWLGLAASAAFAQGDRFGTVRFLSEAYRLDGQVWRPHLQAADVRAEADEELHEMLDRAGIPRFED